MIKQVSWFNMCVVQQYQYFTINTKWYRLIFDYLVVKASIWIPIDLGDIWVPRGFMLLDGYPVD